MGVGGGGYLGKGSSPRKQILFALTHCSRETRKR